MRKRKLPSLSKDHRCFGAGPANEYGLRMEFYTDGECVYSELKLPEYMNSWKGIVHGGIVSTILDEIMFYTAMCTNKCIALTKEANVKFHKPALFKKMPFKVTGKMSEKVKDTGCVISGKLFDEDGTLCASSYGKFGLVKTQFIRKFEILQEDDICMIENLIRELD